MAGNTPPVVPVPPVFAPPATVVIVLGSGIGAWPRDDAPDRHATATAARAIRRRRKRTGAGLTAARETDSVTIEADFFPGA